MKECNLNEAVCMIMGAYHFCVVGHMCVTSHSGDVGVCPDANF